MKLEISKRARRQIEKLATWWSENRPAAPSRFLDELAAVEQLIHDNPEAGIAYATRSGGVRRILLVTTKHHLYYRYRVDRDELVVIAVWGAPKQRGPKLG